VLRGLSLVVVSNLNNVVLPVGHKLIQNKENETVNLAPKGTKDYFVFLAYSDQVTILGCPITPLPSLMQSGQSTGNQGMVNDF